METNTFENFSDGKALYGADFSEAQLEEWFRDEQEAYFNLGHLEYGSYGYHALNWRHGFRHLPQSPFEHVLGMGSAFGDELQPVLARARKITLVDPSDGFTNNRFKYVKPVASGRLPFDDESFDLVTCFNVLHHVANVSEVMCELARCTRRGGWLLVREPTTSLGNWDKPRSLRTLHERGIPRQILLQMADDAELQVVYQRACYFALMPHIRRVLPKGMNQVFNWPLMVAADDFVSNLPIWTKKYHPTSFFAKFRPHALAMVLKKP
jgi:SAM-dependent methyltransferase